MWSTQAWHSTEGESQLCPLPCPSASHTELQSLGGKATIGVPHLGLVFGGKGEGADQSFSSYAISKWVETP